MGASILVREILLIAKAGPRVSLASAVYFFCRATSSEPITGICRIGALQIVGFRADFVVHHPASDNICNQGFLVL